jgi:hypothetical protein
MVSEEKIFEKVYDNGLRMTAKARMTFGLMSQDIIWAIYHVVFAFKLCPVAPPISKHVCCDYK